MAGEEQIKDPQTDPVDTSDSQQGLSGDHDASGKEVKSTSSGEKQDKTVDWESRFKDTQAAFTRSQQQAKEQQARYERELQAIKEQSTQFQQRLVNALSPEQKQAHEQFSPEDLAAADRLISQTATGRMLKEQANRYQQQLSVMQQEQRSNAIVEAATKMQNEFGLDEAKQNELKSYIERRPFLLTQLQYVRKPADAYGVFLDAYKAWDYDNLKANAKKMGVAEVEKDLQRAEKASSSQQPSRSSGDTSEKKLSVNDFGGNFKAYMRAVAERTFADS